MQRLLGQVDENQVCQPLGTSQSNSELEVMMPQGSGPNNTLTLCVVVTDKFKSTAMATLNITSSPPDPGDLSSDALDNLMEDAVEAQLESGNVGAALGAVISIGDTVQGSNDTSGESHCTSFGRDKTRTRESVYDWVEETQMWSLESVGHHESYSTTKFD